MQYARYDRPFTKAQLNRINAVLEDCRNGSLSLHNASTFVTRYPMADQAATFLRAIPVELNDIYRSWLDYHDVHAINGRNGYHSGPSDDTDLILAMFELFRAEVPHSARRSIESTGCFCRGTTSGGVAVTASHESVSDTHLEFFSTPDAPPLHRINLDGSSVSDDGLRFLSTQRELQELWLRKTQIEGQGLEHPSPAKLRDLRLSECFRLRPDELKVVVRFRNLERIDLAHTAVNDAAVTFLGQLSQLEYLDLSGTPISDTGVARLHPLNNIARLDLSKTRLSDNGLSQLKHLNSLRALEIDDTRVTEAGFEKLRLYLPELKDHSTRRRRFAVG